MTIESSNQAILEANGLRINGLETNGVGANGVPINGLRINGLRINGLRINGLRINGLRINGLRINGLRINGLRINGLRINGLRINGLPINGAGLDGIRIADVQQNSLPLSPGDVDAVTALFTYLAECALTSDQTATFYDHDGQPFGVRGVSGHDPGWLYGPPDLGKTDVVAQCVEVSAAADPALDVEDVRADVATAKKLLRYMVECALPEGDAAILEDETDQPWILSGAFGLAPGWKHGPMTPGEREYVSACLLARSNSEGRTVQISIRSAEIAFTGAELAAYSHHEGGFMGDFFADTPWAKTCSVDGQGISGRVCTTGDCGFEDIGPCASVCNPVTRSVTIARGDVSADETTLMYDDCEGGAHRNVVNTYLNLDEHNSFVLGAHYSCAQGSDRDLHCWGLNYQSAFVDNECVGVHLAPQRAYDNARDDVLSMWQNPGVYELDAPLCIRKGGHGEVWCRGEQTGGAWQPLARLDDSQAAHALEDVAVVGESGQTLIQSDGSVVLLDEFLDGHALPLGRDVVQTTMISGDNGRLYVLKNDGTVWDAGDADDYSVQQKLLGTTGVEEFRALCSGWTHACALNSFGEVSCWGIDNAFNQQGTSIRSETPVRVRGFGLRLGEHTVTELACGDYHTCALTDAGDVHCWGYNERGAAGGPSQVSTSPHQVGADVFGQSSAVAIQAAGQSTCAQRADGAWYCWGGNDFGQLGDGTTLPAFAPVLNANYSALQN